jgi:glucan phosphoethanolaminetransferase (alkaline phosphatase superfamily)
MDALDRDGHHYRGGVQGFILRDGSSTGITALDIMPALARPLFFAAWVCPTITLLFGDLPIVRVIAAVLAAVLSGAAISTLPPAGFRIARLITCLIFPLSWLWIGYVTLNGNGPTAIDALTAIENTNSSEAYTALGLLVNRHSILIGLLQASLLTASYLSGTTRFGTPLRTMLAAALAGITLCAWTQLLLTRGPAVLPTRQDWQNFPYGSLVDLIVTSIEQPRIVHPLAKIERRVSAAAPVDQTIDSIFIIGETFRFDRDWSALKSGPAFAPLGKRINEGLGVLLPKVCASADGTALSVPMLVTGVPPARHGEADTAPSGLARLGAAGYITAWISAQDDSWFRDEHHNLFRVLHDGYDDALLPLASAFLGRRDPRNKAIVLHLMDSHAAYLDRYPPMDEPAGLDREQTEVLRYHRANEHTLTLLSKIAALLDGLAVPAFAVYVSDHGENLLADHNGLHFHLGARTTAKAAYVPAFVFWNSAFRQATDPGARLKDDLAAPSLAHADIYSIWMSFGGIPTVVAPTKEPEIFGKVNLTDLKSAVPCTALAP